LCRLYCFFHVSWLSSWITVSSWTQLSIQHWHRPFVVTWRSVN
jgi:hypothetical protein